MTRFTPLGFATLCLLVACGDGTLEPIVAGAGGAGASGGAFGGMGGAPFDATGPALVYAHAEGVRLFVELQDFIPAMPSDLGLPGLAVGTPVAVGQVGHDLVIMSEAAIGEVTLVRLDDFALGGSPSMHTKKVEIPPVGDSPQRGGTISGDTMGSIWLLTRATAGDSGVWRNTLRWSPSGSIDGPWVVYEASPSIMSYTLLPDQSTIVADNGFSTFFLQVDRNAETIALVGGNTGLASYRALEVFADALYAVSPNCTGVSSCSESGQLHIWRDLAAIDLTSPTVVIDLPESDSHACSLTVASQGLAVGTCALPSGASEPRLHFFRQPGALISGAQPDQSFVLDEEPVALVSHAWSSDFFDRTISIYARTPGATVLTFEDAGEGAPLAQSTLSTELDQIGRDLLLVP